MTIICRTSKQLTEALRRQGFFFGQRFTPPAAYRSAARHVDCEGVMTTRQRSRRRVIRWASVITGLLFITITLLAPAIAGWITQ